MGISESRRKGIDHLNTEIERLQKELKKKKELHLFLSQSLLNCSDSSKRITDKIGLQKECEILQVKINDVLTDIRALDKKIWRLKHQTKRQNKDL